MNKYLYLTILFIHNVSSFILPPKINSISRFYNHRNHHNNLSITFMNNKNDNENNKNKIKLNDNLIYPYIHIYPYNYMNIYIKSYIIFYLCRNLFIIFKKNKK
jgi:hypothetical protein